MPSLAFLLIFFLFHPVHVAVTSIEREDSDFNVSFKIFFDDFESIIAEKYNVRLNLGKPDERPDKADYFTRYISENFSLKINDETILKLNYQKSRLVEKSIWLYFSLEGSKGIDIQKVEIRNSVMMDMYTDQTDLVMFKSGSFEEGFTLRRGKEKIEINQLSN